MKNILILVCSTVIICGTLLTSCSEYLDVVPDDVATLDHAFQNKNEAKNFMHGCYSYLPNFTHIDQNPGLITNDEFCLFETAERAEYYGWEIARGFQNTNDPYINFWDGKKGGAPLFRGIRDCNIFLENIDVPYDLEPYEKNQWISEVTFLKAYYHFLLMKLYGPIPIVRENLAISEDTDIVSRYREPIDDVVSYIVSLIDESLPNLLGTIEDPLVDQGRITKSIALAIKAKVLTFAASPLFNGNEDYIGFVDNRGVELINTTYDPNKWQLALNALEEAIEFCHTSGHSLYNFVPPVFAGNLSDSTIIAMGTRGAVTEKWNQEIIWGDSDSDPGPLLQWLCHPAFSVLHGGGKVGSTLAPSLNIVEQFYTNNGVPIDEDIAWEGKDIYGTRTATSEERFYIEPGYETVNLHFDREPRFYGNICFDGGTLYGNGRINDDTQLKVTKFRVGGASAIPASSRYSNSGYLVKKLIHYQTSIGDNESVLNTYRYVFPIVRLADLYLLYAEVQNEVKAQPDADVYKYIDMVRERSGLKGVVESWTNFSNQPDKPTTKDGMRSIIQQERMIEFAFEGVRTFDINRWKRAEEFMNKPIRGWSVFEENVDLFYTMEEKYKADFTLKNYLWPIKQGTLLKNTNLLQNPGW
ncbi:RagB/SusD family nutrient uptake outer membrane protein [Puteibacter caeruleilacunae]|nr:RagB/SusD family nutrient uptake outer membrane protein [Puteibacter caeruleilacunae]